jgi:MinD-like ATPase involved in chromosome partitioning or flagellar assembly
MTTLQNEVYVGDVGTQIVLDCEQDISTATVREILARKPDGTVVTWPASASGTDAISYTILAGDLDQRGQWRLQARVTMPDGSWLGRTAKLLVYSPFT